MKLELNSEHEEKIYNRNFKTIVSFDHSKSLRTQRMTTLLKCIRLSRLSATTELIGACRMRVCILRARLTQRVVPPPGYDTEDIK